MSQWDESSPPDPRDVSLQGQLGALMSILKEHVCQMEKDQLNSHQSELTSFFLIALDFRAEHSGVSRRSSAVSPSFLTSRLDNNFVPCLQDDQETTATIEGYVIDCLVAMVMKLSEVTFRTLFFKVTLRPARLQWASAVTADPGALFVLSSATGGNRTLTSAC